MIGFPSALRARVVALAAAMRMFGVNVSPAEEIVALEALLSVDIGDAEDFRLALRAELCRSREAQGVFDRLYPRWLRGGDLTPDETASAPPTEGGQAGAAEPVASSAVRRSARARDASPGDRGAAERSRYSPAAALRPGGDVTLGRDARALALREADALLQAIRVGQGRRSAAGRGRRLDLRRSLHAALRSQGEMLTLYRRRRKPRPPRVLLLCDGSRSMQEENAGVLRLGQALLRRSPRAEVFLFSTGLRRVSRALRKAHSASASLSGLGEGYGGGTRIGAALQSLLLRHGSLLRRDSVVLVASDGLDTGEIALLSAAMAAIRSRCAYVFWLNPLAGTPGFAPLQRGMQAALPYVDLLWDMHDPHALSRIARRIREGRIPA